MDRVCKQCDKSLPLDRFEQYKPGKHRRVCKSCRNGTEAWGRGHPGVAPNGEDIRATTATGRTCLDCNTWKGRDCFRVVAKTGNLCAYCIGCENQRNTDKYQADKSDPEYRTRRYSSNQNAKNKLRREVIAAYGGKCACCGEAQPEFLTLDHRNNDGAKHRKDEKLSTGGQTWAYARKHDFPDIFQLLCWNCNCAKGMLGYCPHEFT